MIDIPYNFSGTFKFEDYETIKSRAKGFDTFEIFGKDQSGMYDMFFVSVGNPSKPCMFITTGMHPTEWQTIMYTLSTLEMLRDDTYPNSNLRQNLVDNFFIVYVPLMNPYGIERILNNEHGIYEQFADGRKNVNDIDLNSDFYNFTQQESRNIRMLGNRFKPFAYLDAHMFQPEYSVAYDRNTILAGGQQPTGNYQEIAAPITAEWKQSMESYVGEEITQWTNMQTETSGLSRNHFAKQSNPFTPHTLSYITEIVRPAYVDGPLVRKLTDGEIYRYGMAHNYLFFKTSINYFEEYGEIPSDSVVSNGTVYKIQTPQKTIHIKRDSKDIVYEVDEIYNDNLNHPNIRTTLTRNNDGEVIRVNKVDI